MAVSFHSDEILSEYLALKISLVLRRVLINFNDLCYVIVINFTCYYLLIRKCVYEILFPMASFALGKTTIFSAHIYHVMQVPRVFSFKIYEI